MRKLKLQVQISIDGFIAGPKGEMDWMVWDWDDALKQYVSDITEPVDTILLGRTLAQGFIPHWAAAAAQPDHPEFAAGKKYTDTQKIVFSRTLHQSEWAHTEWAADPLVDRVTSLKKQQGRDIIAYGGARFVSALIAHGLIDEFHLFVNPTALGSGMAIFESLHSYQKMSLEFSKSFSCGVVVNQYVKSG